MGLGMRRKSKATLAVGLVLATLIAMANKGGLNTNYGQTERPREFHSHAGESASDCSERPRHEPMLDVLYMERQGWFAPYSCRAVSSPRQVDIEHIVAWAEAKRSGLSCDRASEFVNDPLNITVAYPQLNRQEKRDKDAARWLPEHNRCWFATKVVEVKRKYGLSMDAAESAAIENALVGCSVSEKAAPACLVIASRH